MIRLIGDVSEDLVADFHDQVARQLQKAPDSKNLTVLLSTAGGDVYSAFAIYDAIKGWSKHRGRTKVIATGACMSAGSMIILQAADQRFATPNTHLMVHFGDENSDSAGASKHNKRLTKEMKEILLKKTGKPARTVSSWFSKDTYFDVHEAVERNLIDGVINLYETP